MGRMTSTKEDKSKELDTKEVSGVEAAANDLLTIGEYESKKAAKKEAREKKADNKKNILLSLTEDKKDAYKNLFGAQGFSLLQGIRMCLAFVDRNIKNGTLILDESGIGFNRIKDL